MHVKIDNSAKGKLSQQEHELFLMEAELQRSMNVAIRQEYLSGYHNEQRHDPYIDEDTWALGNASQLP